MTVLSFAIILLGFSYLAGILGAMTGLGGGVVIIPVLVLLFHVNIHYAMGASLISVMATSSGSAMAFLRGGYTNLRIGMFLETGAVIGAFCGALLVTIIPIAIITIVFALVLIFSAYLTVRRKEEEASADISHRWARALQMEGDYPTKNGSRSYRVKNVPLALGIMTIAGGLAGLLGIGSGALKVLAMDQAMRLPYKVATTTSNFIIGITAAVSAGVYFSYGYIEPDLTFPVLIGVIFGSFTGARLLTKVNQRVLRIVFSVVILFLAIEMIDKGLGSL